MDNPQARRRTAKGLLEISLAASVIAVAVDMAAAAFTLGEYRSTGHIHIELGLVMTGLIASVGATCLWLGWWRSDRP